jgi:hypothetical protein
MPTRPSGVALPAQPNTFAALQAMQSIVLAECLVNGLTPFAALNASDAARYGVASAVFIGQPKDFADVYLPQCRIWLTPESESVALAAYAGRAEAELEAIVRVYVDLRPDWYAAEQKILAVRDALWSALLRHERLGGTVATVVASDARPGRGLCYEQIAGSDYRCYEARWLIRQQWSFAGGRVV